MFFSVTEKLFEASVFEVKNHWKIKVEVTKKIMEVEGKNVQFTFANLTRTKEVNDQEEEIVLLPTDVKTFKYDDETMREKILKFARDFLPVAKQAGEVARTWNEVLGNEEKAK